MWCSSGVASFPQLKTQLPTLGMGLPLPCLATESESTTKQKFSRKSKKIYTKSKEVENYDV